jgi:hypothetical protein
MQKQIRVQRRPPRRHGGGEPDTGFRDPVLAAAREARDRDTRDRDRDQPAEADQ